MKTLIQLLPAFVEALEEQLKSDEKRWGDTWMHRDREGQEERAFARFRDYWDMYERGDVPIPWLKIAGECLIAWVRERPQLYK